jgi:hypothetical protein
VALEKDGEDNWTANVRNENVLHGVKTERNILQTMKKRLTRMVTSCIGTAIKNTLLREREGRIEVTRRRGRRPKQLLYDRKEKRGYCKLKEEALDRTLWRTHFGRGCRPVMICIGDNCLENFITLDFFSHSF